jgi:hypothetical protein
MSVVLTEMLISLSVNDILKAEVLNKHHAGDMRLVSDSFVTFRF